MQLERVIGCGFVDYLEVFKLPNPRLVNLLRSKKINRSSILARGDIYLKKFYH